MPSPARLHCRRCATYCGIALLLLMLAFALNALSSWQFRHAVSHHALYELGQLVRATRWQWSFDGSSLLSGTINDIRDIEQHDGSLTFTTNSSDPYFAVNQYGDIIDARYSTMIMEITSSAATEMQLYFTPTNDDLETLYASRTIAIAKGRQTLRIALDQMPWSSTLNTGETVPWGGATQAIALLRMDPAAHKDVQMRISQLRLSARQPVTFDGQPLTVARWNTMIAATKTDASPVIELNFPATEQDLAVLAQRSHSGMVTIVNDSRRWPWQQSAHAQYRAIKHVAPDTIILPDAMATLANTPVDQLPATPLHWQLLTWRNAVLVSSAAVSLLLFGLLHVARHRPVQTGLPALVELCGLLVLLYCTWWIACHDQLIWLLLTLPAFIATCIHLTRQQQGSAWHILGLAWPERRMWRDTVTASLLLLLSWAFFFLVSDRSTPVSWRAVAIGFALYPVWGLIQQFFMGPLLAASLSRIWHNNTQAYPLCSIITATVFSLLHFPNQQLMLVTWFTCSAWSWLYLHYRSIIPLALSHGILGTLYFQLSPDLLQPDGNVGMKYLDWLY